MVAIAIGASSCERPDAASPPPRPPGSPPTEALDSATLSSSASPVAMPFDAGSVSPTSSLVLAGRFAPGVSAAAFPLGRSAEAVAVAQSSSHRAGASRRSCPTADTSDIDVRQFPSRLAVSRTFRFPRLGGAGPQQAWITVLDETDFPRLDMTIWQIYGARGLPQGPGRLAAVGELEAGHWVGLPMGIGPYVPLRREPLPVRVATEGHGRLSRSLVAPDLRLFDVAWLGEGKVCGLGLIAVDGGFLEDLWTAEW